MVLLWREARNFPALPAVYIVFRRNKSGVEADAVYVGKTRNFQMRMRLSASHPRSQRIA
jgi:hypothetical protein